jgi:hypothetical protein
MFTFYQEEINNFHVSDYLPWIASSISNNENKSITVENIGCV